VAAIPDTMLAAVYRGNRTVNVESWPTPSVGPLDVLVAVDHCGVCGSDIHLILEGWGQVPETGAVEGHEWSGTVAAVGTDVDGWSVGDPVVGRPGGCGHCRFCQAGRPSLCDRRGAPTGGSWQGAFATFIREPADRLSRVPNGLSLRAAALTEPLAVALHGVTRSGVRPGQRALVTGAGPIGALVTAALFAKGITDVTVSEPFDLRRSLVEKLGAHSVHPDELVTPGGPMDLVAEPYDVALECSGRADAMQAALGQLDKGGSLVLVGAGIKPPRFDPNRILLNELMITGAFVYDVGGFDDALGLLASGAVPVDVVTEAGDVPLDGLIDALEGLARGQLAGKVMIVPTKGA
jgi:(R,R)-butanediol dehydrogenase/meso-butanediol dehydrogenase/diacetyl reductase